MSKIKEGLASLRNGFRETLPVHHSGHDDQPRGGPQDKVEAKIEESEDWQDDDVAGSDKDDSMRSGQAKPLEDFLNPDDPPRIRSRYGKLDLVQSREGQGEHEGWVNMPSIGARSEGQVVVFRARVHALRRISSGLVFIIFRDHLTTIQGVLSIKEGEISESMVRWAEHLRSGSIVIVKGKVQTSEQEVKSTSIQDVEVHIHELHVVAARAGAVPFSVYEAESAPEGHTIADRVRFANRILDLRTPTSQAIFRLQSAVCRAFREFLDDKAFLEIHTPKLQGGATEGGSEVFKLDYFGRPAFLAQSPQLAKQMCISADFGRVYEIGPVFRAENSNTPRHMTEYTGLDLEMAIDWHYHEAMWLIDSTLKHIFKALYSKYRKEVQAIKHHFPQEDLVWHEETTRITFAEGAKMLNESGWQNEDGSQQSEYEDLSTKAEKRLGELVKEKYHTDYYILDKFPASARPFYTMLDPQDPKVTNSFDFMVRGQEILSGGQRIHDAELLIQQIQESGTDPATLKEYIEGFQWAAPPHAGAGIGLERLVSLIFELGNLRYGTLFPRDPKSFPSDPNASDLRHPEDATLQRPKGHLQPLENLVANYGDSTNTSWFDKRFQIWRDSTTGAAVAYVPSHHRAILPGNPLCAPHQLEDVISAFLRWLKVETSMKPIFVLVSKDVEKVVGEKFGWKSFTNVAEQRVNLASNEHLNLDTEVQRKIRHAQKDTVKVTSYGNDVPEDVRKKCDEAIKKWQDSREGAQVHLSELSPWTDSTHRQYFIAQDRDGKVHAMVVTAQLAPRYGAQLKWAFDFPEATNGAIEHTVQTALKSLADAGIKSCTFGSGAASDLAGGQHLGVARATMLNSVYQAYAAKFHVDRKAAFRTKFNTQGDPLYFCYPRGGMGQKGIRAIVDFFKE
ncbi:aspartate-tRNA(Asn) ligase [Cyphellophora europaea CBS 101466]|uniref:aspartate--tRNA ligase n=1 Tax=Cyphellophora europaea (strain CBS 101466) TaxID=1220924 RepID=W2SCN5_CYPE1|nr:aspartate-tRNA(Asn) ligase [Cyphellophora europaea CBS 101466]ETN46481.1 aspartate-tRNA(Asn) ligase [Cyphellophora europaea CBS 101466]